MAARSVSLEVAVGLVRHGKMDLCICKNVHPRLQVRIAGQQSFRVRGKVWYKYDMFEGS